MTEPPIERPAHEVRTLAYLISLVFIGLGVGAVALSYRDMATAVGLALVTVGVIVLAGVITRGRSR